MGKFVAAPDCCEICQDLDGKEVSELPHPNCRCSILPDDTSNSVVSPVGNSLKDTDMDKPLDIGDQLPAQLNTRTVVTIKNAADEQGRRVFSALMTVEKRDDRGNIFRVAGTKVRPDIKLLAQHLDSAPNGEPTVVAKVLSTYKTTDGGIPAIGMDFIFAETRLGQEYEYLYANGFMTDLSTGVMPKKWTTIVETVDGVRQATGADITDSEVYECSFVAVGINRGAKLLSGLECRELVCNALEHGEVGKAVELIKGEKEKPVTTPIVDTEIMNSIKGLLQSNQESMATLLSRLGTMESRLDELVANSTGGSATTPAPVTNSADVDLKARDSMVAELRDYIRSLRS